MNDEALFNTAPRLGELTARPPPSLTGLAFDERMTMHAEQSSAPHPERPDRIRAVIARLQASGLAGDYAEPAHIYTTEIYLIPWSHLHPCTFSTDLPLIQAQLMLITSMLSMLMRLMPQPDPGHAQNIAYTAALWSAKWESMSCSCNSIKYGGNMMDLALQIAARPSAAEKPPQRNCRLAMTCT